ncbi:MAG: hypothetical protein WCD89_06295 [Anaerocolumna sp.]
MRKLKIITIQYNREIRCQGTKDSTHSGRRHMGTDRFLAGHEGKVYAGVIGSTLFLVTMQGLCYNTTENNSPMQEEFK